MSDAGPWEGGSRAAALAGDAAAWRALYDSAFDAVARYACWRSGGYDDLTDEIVQEAWLAAARRLASFQPERAPFAAWVCGIAANTARNLIRKKLKERSRVTSLVSVPEPSARESEECETVALALADLPEHYESALREKYFERLSVEQMARRRGESQKAIESLLSRARQAFREAYARREGEAP